MTALQYEIRVAGSVPASVLEELDDVRVVSHSIETVLRGPVPDQAALIGIVNRLQGWGIELHAVRQLPPDHDPSPDPGPPAANPAVDTAP
jgi:hypothetical protein